MNTSIANAIELGYQSELPTIVLGKALYQDGVIHSSPIQIPLKSLNRHGLIAGATGTGKTKTLQLMAEALSDAGVPCLLMDLKGDLSGLAANGNEGSEHIQDRHSKLEIEYKAKAYPVELLSLTDPSMTRLRATVLEFGPILLSKVLELNENQEGVMSVVFKYADDHQLPIVDLEDLKSVLRYLSNEGREELKAEYGFISPSSVGAIMRKIVGLEQQGAEAFFGEPSFEVNDLLRLDEAGRGYLSIMRLTDIQNRPKLFSTFMLSLLAEVYSSFPEEGDLDKPKLCIFIDEAHLVFKESSKALLDQLESVVKLIRSKGVGIFFCTQSPGDVPESILSQLGLKVQHALRAFTAKDRKEIRLVAQNYPESEFYSVEDLLTSLGIGEAAITGLDRKGRPTPIAHTYLLAPASRMDILEPQEIQSLLAQSDLRRKYDKTIDKDSAHEMLERKLKQISVEEEKEEERIEEKQSPSTEAPRRKTKAEASTLEKVLRSPAAKSFGVALVGSLTRVLFGTLGKRKR